MKGMKFVATLLAADMAEVRVAGTAFILNAVRGPGGGWQPISLEYDGDEITLDAVCDPEDFASIGISPGALAAIEKAERV